MMWFSPLTKRRWRNFKANRLAYFSFIIFTTIFMLTLFAEFIANDRPLLIKYRDTYFVPVLKMYPETTFGGDFETHASYHEKEIQCLIKTGGDQECFDAAEMLLTSKNLDMLTDDERGWIIWPPIPYSYNTIVDRPGRAPSAPDKYNLLGTDDVKRDVLARIIYGTRLSIFFALIVTILSSIIGIIAGAIQGFFGGKTDLIFQRLIEIWSATPSLYVIIILFAILGRSFWLLVFISVLFGWPALVGVVRAEFLRARNFEHIRAAEALGVSQKTIIFRHILPNALISTITLLPFIITGSIGALASLDFLGFGLPASLPSLGELTLQAKQNLQAPWLGFAAFFTFTLLLSLMVFIFEGIRDAFDPRKIFK